MKYAKVVAAGFLARPNRFIAEVELEGRRETVHVKNTGRCRELLVPGTRCYLSDAGHPARKTRYDLIAVEKGKLLINMDSQIVNDVAEEFLKRGTLFSPNALIRREKVFGASRFDFYIEDGEKKCFLEVKGVTLEKEGVVSFPDAPTARGARHLNELVSAVEQGFEGCLLFIVQMAEARLFRPNDATDPEFGQALRRAARAGVRIMALTCRVTPDSVTAEKPLPVEL